MAGAGAQFATEPEPGTVLHIDHSDNLAGDGFPWESKFAGCWVQFAGSREALAVAAFLRCPTRSMREQITAELQRFYDPPCGDRLYEEPPKGDDPPGGSRVPARPRPPLLPPAAAAEQAEAEDVNPSWVGPGGPASAGPS
ncbi:MAG TPA: hypothetical protein VFW71_14310 [Actinomycetota bacterium]|nr:hypothetical protein [Actinomycetota bacterium]